jgi:hypothetical protein
MKRCPECGRGGRGDLRLSAPVLLTLAAREVADGEDLESETLSQMLLLLRELRAAEATIEQRIAHVTRRMVAGPSTALPESHLNRLSGEVPGDDRGV